MTELGRLPGALEELRRFAEHDRRCLDGTGCHCGLDDLVVELDGLVCSALRLEGDLLRARNRAKALADERDQIARSARKVSVARRAVLREVEGLRARAEERGLFTVADECRTILGTADTEEGTTKR